MNRHWMLEFGCLLLLCLAVRGGYVMATADEPTTAQPSAQRRSAVAAIKPFSMAELADQIDAAIAHRLAAADIRPAPPSDDWTFVRRIYLDLFGVTPTVEEAVRFVDDRRLDKRSRLIDQMTEDPRFGIRLADLWEDLLFRRQPDNSTWPLPPFRSWLAEQFYENRPWNELVADLITATGPQYGNPAITMFAGGDKTTLNPVQATDLISSALMGIQLQCAQCHHHPYSRWRHEDYWGMAAFFRGTVVSGSFDGSYRVPRPSRDQYEWLGHVRGVANSSKPNPRHQPSEYGLQVAPRFPQGSATRLPDMAAGRTRFSDWLTAPENSFLAPAFVNRVWYQLLGRGLVHPVDDLRPENPATHPEILEQLSDQFVVHHFDIRWLYRTLCRTEVYQRSSQYDDRSDDADRLRAHASLRMLTPSQRFDILLQLFGARALDDGYGIDGDKGARERFVAFHRLEQEALPTEYSRDMQSVFRSMNSLEQGLDSLVATYDLALADRDLIRQLYLQLLTRPPSAEEQAIADASLAAADSRSEGLQDLAWALLQTADFHVIR